MERAKRKAEQKEGEENLNKQRLELEGLTSLKKLQATLADKINDSEYEALSLTEKRKQVEQQIISLKKENARLGNSTQDKMTQTENLIEMEGLKSKLTKLESEADKIATNESKKEVEETKATKDYQDAVDDVIDNYVDDERQLIEQTMKSQIVAPDRLASIGGLMSSGNNPNQQHERQLIELEKRQADLQDKMHQQLQKLNDKKYGAKYI